jgi:hypothetical protein
MGAKPLPQLGCYGGAGQTGIGQQPDQQTNIFASSGKMQRNPRSFMNPIHLQRDTLQFIEINRMAALHDDIL